MKISTRTATTLLRHFLPLWSVRARSSPPETPHFLSRQCSPKSAAVFIVRLTYWSSTARDGCKPSTDHPVREEHEPTELLHSIIRCMSSTCIPAHTPSLLSPQHPGQHSGRLRCLRGGPHSRFRRRLAS